MLLAAASTSASDSASRAYARARPLYFELKSNSDKQQYRHHWKRVIRAFERVARRHPETQEAAKARYTIAELWNDLADVSYLRSDQDKALRHYGRLLEQHPNSRFADDALWQRSQIFLRRDAPAQARRELQRLLSHYPDGDMYARTRRAARRMHLEVKENATPPAASGESGESTPRRDRPAVTAIRHWSKRDYSRIAVYLTRAVKAELQRQPASGQSPAKLILALPASASPDSVEIEDIADDQLLQKVRIKGGPDKSTHIVLTLRRAVEPQMLRMQGPFRIVVDLHAKAQSQDAQRSTTAPRKPRVVLDPGHGGRDTGALGPEGIDITEKEVVLDVAKRVAARLREHGAAVKLTRTRDEYLSLEERTAIANGFNADVFVSVHANAHKQPKVSGIETYYLDVSDERYTERLQQRETHAEDDASSDLDLILADLATKVATRRSRQLAKQVQSRLMAAADPVNPSARDLGVKGALFYVLMGARMPAVLVETSFMSNPTEARLLAGRRYRRILARAIASGILTHMKEPLMAASLSADAEPQ